MTTYPGAILKLIPAGANDPRIQPVGVVLHVAVSEAKSLHDYFDGPSGGIESHMYVRRDGQVEQYRDFDYEADAQYKGNSWIAGAHRNGFISIETQGMGPGEWTDEQLATIEAIIRWLSSRYGFPLRRVPSMQPSSPAAGGVGYHTMYAGWSNVPGKVCPGPDRIRQFNDTLLPRLQEDDMTPAEMWTELKSHEDWFIDKARRALDQELGDESGAGEFSNRIVAKVLAGMPPAQAVVQASVDLDLLAAKVADLLAERLKG